VETHSVILPHAVAFNRDAAGDAMHEVGAALGSTDAANGVFDLARRIGAPASLREIGMPEVGLERAVDLALANPYWNPRPLEREGIRSLLDDAWHGRRPSE
jgi:alcohol dehydrogenase class IV